MTSSLPSPPPAAAPDPAVAAALRALRDDHPETVLLAAPLRDLTTLRIGGPAVALCRVQTIDQARRFLEYLDGRGVARLCLGAGSNVLADDRGFDGAVLRMEIDTFIVSGETVLAGAGMPFDAVIERSLAAGLIGLEFASGIPGTLGGALVGNAGCFGRELGEFLLEALLLRADGRLQTVGPEAFAFGYRRSALQGGPDLVLQAKLRLRRAPTEAAWRERQERRRIRREKHPTTEPCAGSWFKNLEPEAPGGRRRPAGELLDLAGAKSMRVGGAAVYAKHANIIINACGATSAEVTALAGMMAAAVRERFGVQLQPEVRTLAWRA